MLSLTLEFHFALLTSILLLVFFKYTGIPSTKKRKESIIPEEVNPALVDWMGQSLVYRGKTRPDQQEYTSHWLLINFICMHYFYFIACTCSFEDICLYKVIAYIMTPLLGEKNVSWHWRWSLLGVYLFIYSLCFKTEHPSQLQAWLHVKWHCSKVLEERGHVWERAIVIHLTT